MTSLAGANDPGDMHHQVLHATEAASSSIDNAETLQCASQQGPKCETPQYTGSSTVFIMRYIYINHVFFSCLVLQCLKHIYIYKYIELLYRLQDLPRMSQMMKRLHQKLPRKHLTTQDSDRVATDQWFYPNHLTPCRRVYKHGRCRDPCARSGQ